MQELQIGRISVSLFFCFFSSVFFTPTFHLRLLRTFAGVLREKIHMRAILKQNTANYISLESLINADFEKKKINCRFLQFYKRKSQTTTKMTMCHSVELIGYQTQAHWQNNCTVLITKDQSPKVCQHLSIF